MRRGKLVIVDYLAAYRGGSIWLRISCAVFLNGIKNFFLAPASLSVPEIILTLIAAGGVAELGWPARCRRLSYFGLSLGSRS